MFSLHVGLCNMYMPGACRGQRRASDTVTQKSQVAVSSHGSARSQTLVFWFAGAASEPALESPNWNYESDMVVLPSL